MDKTSNRFTTDLFPKNGVWITEAFSPAGFFVAKYDAKSLAEGNRWFPTMPAAEAYAATL